MNGVLLIDKPSGPTSHDVVQRMRRVLGERSIGHTGTLDPLASGLLPLVVGRATRLASLLTGGDKTYEATVRLGCGTDTDDSQGRTLDRMWGPVPGPDEVQAAVGRFRGRHLQMPPQFSAKKVDGAKAYDLARQSRPVTLQAVEVTVHELTCLGIDGRDVTMVIRATAGFYVRSLARDLGLALGCGGHISALRRIASGCFTIAAAIPLAEAEQAGRAVALRLVSPADALPHLPAVTVTVQGLERALHGNPLQPAHLGPGHPLSGEWPAGEAAAPPNPVRVLGPDGRLVALARVRGSVLHPVVVLG
jgi:tRNA pseudouridine55 synthase